MRKLTEKLYEDQINALYEVSAMSKDKVVEVSLEVSSKTFYERSAVIAFLRSIIGATFPPGTTIDEDEDLYGYGMDSIQTLEITSSLKRNLHRYTSMQVTWISPRTIFRHSTFASLADLITAFLNDGIIPQEDYQLAAARTLDETVARHVETLPRKPTLSTLTGTSSVAIIGSTGYLGLHLVETLMERAEITRIYCLNRGRDAQVKQSAALRLLCKSNVQSLLQKLVYITIDFEKAHLGLTKNTIDLIFNEVDAVIYNSWKLDFNLGIRSFEPFIRAARDLVELVASSERGIHIIFISSLSAVASMAEKTVAPEAAVQDAAAALNIGYAQSKLTTERVLEAASHGVGIPISIVRVGQIGGPTGDRPGPWADQPWISAMVRTAKSINSIPDLPAYIDWVPVDSIAQVLYDVAVNPAPTNIQVFNVCPESPSPWKMFVDVLRDNHDIREVIPMREWVQRLRSITDPSVEDIARMPALKLLDYYDSIAETRQPSFASGRIDSVSKVGISAVDVHMLERWLSSWDM